MSQLFFCTYLKQRLVNPWIVRCGCIAGASYSLAEGHVPYEILDVFPFHVYTAPSRDKDESLDDIVTLIFFWNTSVNVNKIFGTSPILYIYRLCNMLMLPLYMDKFSSLSSIIISPILLIKATSNCICDLCVTERKKCLAACSRTF